MAVFMAEKRIAKVQWSCCDRIAPTLPGQRKCSFRAKRSGKECSALFEHVYESYSERAASIYSATG
jgi:hypothetical protein